jgi:hypothetical protein
VQHFIMKNFAMFDGAQQRFLRGNLMTGWHSKSC